MNAETYDRDAGGFRVGVDLGGSKIERIVLDSDGVEQDRKRVAAPRGSYSRTIDAIEALVREADAIAGQPCPVGVGIPGTVSPGSGLVQGANSTWLNGQPLERDLSERLGRPIRTANDANCFALSEATDGAGANAAIVFGVILGTGVGGGLVIDGRLVPGHAGMAGEWGHTAFPWREHVAHRPRWCWCGKADCIEAWLSGPGLLSEIPEDQRPDGVPELMDRANDGDSLARDLLAAYPVRLARALGTVVNILDPDVIVLGGGLSNLSGLPEKTETALAAQIFNIEVATRIVRAQHGDSSGVRGAAWLWPADPSAA